MFPPTSRQNIHRLLTLLVVNPLAITSSFYFGQTYDRGSLNNTYIFLKNRESPFLLGGGGKP